MANEVDRYVSGLHEPTRSRIAEIYAATRRLVPEAVEEQATVCRPSSTGAKVGRRAHRRDKYEEALRAPSTSEVTSPSRVNYSSVCLSDVDGLRMSIPDGDGGIEDRGRSPGVTVPVAMPRVLCVTSPFRAHKRKRSIQCQGHRNQDH